MRVVDEDRELAGRRGWLGRKPCEERPARNGRNLEAVAETAKACLRLRDREAGRMSWNSEKAGRETSPARVSVCEQAVNAPASLFSAPYRADSSCLCARFTVVIVV
jgi:hypothetical protein